MPFPIRLVTMTNATDAAVVELMDISKVRKIRADFLMSLFMVQVVCVWAALSLGCFLRFEEPGSRRVAVVCS